MHYRIAPGDLPLTALQDALPDADFELNDEERILICRYPESTHEAEHVNARVLRVLLDHAIGVTEVHRGGELETAYLNHSREVSSREVSSEQ
jgi:hypothetical protein